MVSVWLLFWKSNKTTYYLPRMGAHCARDSGQTKSRQTVGTKIFCTYNRPRYFELYVQRVKKTFLIFTREPPNQKQTKPFNTNYKNMYKTNAVALQKPPLSFPFLTTIKFNYLLSYFTISHMVHRQSPYKYKRRAYKT